MSDLSERDEDEALVINMDDDEEEEEEEEEDSLGSVQDLVNAATATPGHTFHPPPPKHHTVSAPLSANTKRNMQWGVRVWEKWGRAWNKKVEKDHKKIPINRGDFILITEEDLGKACSLFVQNVRKFDGSVYPPHSLYNLLFALSRFIKFQLGRPIDILDFRNKAFEPIAEAMNAITKKYSESEMINEQKADAITWEHVKILWDNRVLNYNSAKGLSRAAFIYNSKVFGIRSGRDHRMLLLEYFECGEDERGRYIEFQKGKFGRAKKEANGVTGAKMNTRPKLSNTAAVNNIKQLQMGDDVRIREYEVPDNTRSAYSVHKSYLDMVHQYVRYGPFYIKPLPTEVGTRVRFTSAAVGHNSLGTYVKDMMTDAGISGYFTNLSAGKHEVNQMPDWVRTPYTDMDKDEQQIGPISIVPGSACAVSQMGPTTYIQCLNKNIPIAPKPSGTTTRSTRSSGITTTPGQAAQPFTLTAGGTQTQTLLLVPVSQAPDQITRGMIPTPVNTFQNANATFATTTSSALIEPSGSGGQIINSVTVKEEQVSEEEIEAIDLEIKHEEPNYPDATNDTSRQDYSNEFFSNYAAMEVEATGTSANNDSRKRPLEIQPIEEGDSSNMTALLVKKLKALEDRLQRIEKDDTPLPPPDVPDSSSGGTTRQPSLDSNSAVILDQLTMMEQRLTKLEQCRGSVGRPEGTGTDKLSQLEKTLDKTRATVDATHSKLLQTTEKIDQIYSLLVTKHS